MITNSKTTESFEKIISDLQLEITKRDQVIASYKEKYARLIEEILLAKQQRFAPLSEKNLLQPDLFDEPGVELPAEVKEELEDENINIQGYTRKKHPSRRPLPSYLPREVIIYDISSDEKICECGETLVRIGEEVSEQLKYIPAQVSVIQHVRPKYACKPCQENVKIAAMPILLLPKSIATPELVAHTIISKYTDHLPLYRQKSIWQRMEMKSICREVVYAAGY
jgi:transposase